MCRVPPEALGYAHLGPPAYLDGYGHLHVAPDDELVEKDQARARRAYLWRYAWRLGTLWTRDVADHTPANYVAAAAQLPGGAPYPRGAPIYSTRVLHACTAKVGAA